MPQSNEGQTKKKQSIYAILFLVVATIAAYHGVFTNDFVNYDDGVYITDNVHVKQGLSWENLKWSFSTFYGSNWHPLTWLSHMLDVQLFGLNPAGHHFSNLLLHVFATLLLFGFFRYATRNLLLSTLIASLFALHPLHVDSVAWAAERKDVLSAVFFFASLWAYVFYTRRTEIKRYVLVLILFALGLMSKPMLVSLPIILLLLDYWPLERISLNKNNFGKLILEKLPFVLMAGCSSVFTILAQRDAIGGLNRIELPIRLANAVVSYGIYLFQTIWPANLAVFYPYTKPHLSSVIIGLLIVLAISIFVGVKRKSAKYLVTGWLWFVITLIPVIGILQVGGQSHADRYTYIPLVGIFIMFLWGIHSISEKLQTTKRKIIIIALFAIVLTLSLKTAVQVTYWNNTFTLFTHALNVTKENDLAHINLGLVAEKEGQLEKAAIHYQKAVDINTNLNDAQYNLGTVLMNLGRHDEAVVHLKKALEINPKDMKALNNLGKIYYFQYQFNDAIPLLQRAIPLAQAAGDEPLAQTIAGNLELVIKERDSLLVVAKTTEK